MNSISKPMLSSLYDSVVQRSLIIRNFNRENTNQGNTDAKNTNQGTSSEEQIRDYKSENIRRYKAALRWDMLMFGTVALTDAMWYDGLLFSLMIQDDDFKKFIDFLSQNKDASVKPLMIKQRNNYRKMFCKSFHYSSVLNAQLQNILMEEPAVNGKLHQLADNNRSDIEITNEELCSAIETEVGAKLAKIKNAGHKKEAGQRGDSDPITEALGDLMDQLCVLGKDIPDGIVSFWEEGRPAYMDYAYEKPREIVEQYSKSTGALSNEFERIKDEINTDNPRRSFIIHELETCELHDGIWFDFAQKFGAEFHKSYNIAIAEQHRCHYIEQYEPFEREYIQDKMEQGLLYVLLESLADMSWEEYNTLYSDENITLLREDWLKAYESQLLDNSGLTDALKKMISYLECVLLTVDGTSDYLAGHILFYYNNGEERLADISGAGQMLIANKLDQNGAFLKDSVVIPKSKLHLFDIDDNKKMLKLHDMCREIYEESIQEGTGSGTMTKSLFEEFFDFAKVPKDGTEALANRRKEEEAKTETLVNRRKEEEAKTEAPVNRRKEEEAKTGVV